ncbi:ATP-dependent zinc protease [Candidatus Woesearchaeota archaeon]|nr:ATP-dependent zinc protease [Candidatus Woesearchaeota archaeon]
MDYSKHNIVGLIERVRIFGAKKDCYEIARIDTGATKSSIDTSLAAELGVGPITKTKLVKSASGKSIRPVVDVKVRIGKKNYHGEFTVADRSHMRYRVLIGQNILTQGFLVDPQRSFREYKKDGMVSKSRRE